VKSIQLKCMRGVEFFSDKNNQQNLRGVKAVGAAARG